MPLWDDDDAHASAPTATALPATGYGLRMLDRELTTRLVALDERVRERTLAGDATAAGDVDVLCTAIAEARELRAEVRSELGDLARRQDRRRVALRRWN